MSKKVILSKRHLVVGLVVATALGIAIYSFSEHQKSVSLQEQPLPTDLFEKLNVTDAKPVGNILTTEETTVCVLGEYENKDVLHKELNSSQRISLAKLDLPTRDLTWHLLFFSESDLSRIYVLEKYSQFALAVGSPSCLSRKDKYFAQSTRVSDGEIRTLIFVSIKKAD